MRDVLVNFANPIFRNDGAGVRERIPLCPEVISLAPNAAICNIQGWQIDLETWKKFQKRFWLFFQVIPGHFFQKNL